MKPPRLSSCSFLLLPFSPFHSCHALEHVLYIYSHPHSIYYIAHSPSHSFFYPLFFFFVAPSPTQRTYLLLSLPDLMPADEGKRRLWRVGGWGWGFDLTCRCFPVSTKTSPQVDNAHTNGCEVTGQE